MVCRLLIDVRIFFGPPSFCTKLDKARGHQVNGTTLRANQQPPPVFTLVPVGQLLILGQPYPFL